MNALITIDQPQQPKDQPSRPGPEPILTAQVQGLFLASLQLVGNVSVACSKARISRPTAYRARRRSPAFARAWDAALLAARVHAEAELADRAINGVEEAVFYHGEEVARRRRYDSRLLLAHLARLDRLAEREELVVAQGLLDDWVDALQRGEDLPDIAEGPPQGGNDPQVRNSLQDSVTGVTGSPSRESEGGGDAVEPCPAEPCPAEPCPDCGGGCADAGAELGPRDCMWFGNRLSRMEDARPADWRSECVCEEEDAASGFVDYLHIRGFEAGLAGWWLVASEADLDALLAGADGEGSPNEASGNGLAWQVQPAGERAMPKAASEEDRG